VSLDPRRLEELSLNSSAPPGQLLYDGWLLRLQPGKAKRARSVNAVYPSTLPLDAKVAYCERLYAEAGLPAIFRITPFCTPPGLDAELERRGYGIFDYTAVESARLEAEPQRGEGVVEIALSPWIDAVGDLRGSSPEQRAGHRARIEGCALQRCCVAILEDGQVVATGLSIVEDGAAGLFDIVTHSGHRRKGLARRVVTELLARAWATGVRDAYLQVDRDNTPARKLYAQFGFAERYLYWYRGREGERH
jgi:ribosomal protein S18 acetylase RimI-like enzyme